MLKVMQSSIINEKLFMEDGYKHFHFHAITLYAGSAREKMP